MRDWKPYLEPQGSKTWNALLLEAADYTIFQSYEWGEYKSKAGWQPIRYISRDKSGSVTGMVQLLLKLGPLGVGIM